MTATATAPTVPGTPLITFTSFVVTRLVAVEWGGFTPDTVSVSAGKTIGWEWNPSGDSDDVHDISFEDNPNLPVSSPTRYGGFHIRKFDGAPRTIRYRCTLHSTGFTDGEVGVVIVR